MPLHGTENRISPRIFEFAAGSLEMPLQKVKTITDSLRYRVERALEMGALKSGDRLPSARELSREMGADPRVILSAYRTLEQEGLVEIRPRSGNYVSPRNIVSPSSAPPPTPVVVNILSEAISRGYSTKEFAGYLADASFGRRLRAVVVAGISDQAEGIGRELRDDFSLSSVLISPKTLKQDQDRASGFKGADLIVTTAEFAALVSRIGKRMQKPVIVLTIRPNIIGDEWVALMRRGVNVVAADREFVGLLRRYLSSSPQAERVKMFVVGDDSLSAIEPGNPTYVTHAARKKLGTTRIPGTLIPPPRILSDQCVRAILNIIVSLRYDRAVPGLS